MKENFAVSEGTNDRGFTIGTSTNNIAINESTVKVKTLEKCSNERIDWEMSSIIDTVEVRIQNAILTAIDNIVAPKSELAIKSINASSGQDVTSVAANSERGKHVGINASFENASGNDNILHVSNVIDEPRHDIHDEVSELSVPEPRFGRQTHTHHNYITQVSEETEGRVMKKLSQKFSRTESKNMLGALLRIDDFLMNPLNQGYSGSTPEMSRNEYRINQETNDADSHSNPHPEAGIFHNQTTRKMATIASVIYRLE